MLPNNRGSYRTAGAAPRQTRTLVFDRLPPAVRDRLARGLANGAPDALLAAPSGFAPRLQRAAVGVGSVALFAIAACWHHGLGDALATDAFQPAWFSLVYAGLLAIVGLSVVGFVTVRRFQRGAPFPSGRYLFSLDLLEVNGGELLLTSLDTLRGVEARGPKQVAAVFADGHAVVFPTAQGEDPTTVADGVAPVIRAALDLTYPADETRLQRLDPFFEVRVSEDWDAAADGGKASSPRRGRPALGAIAAVVASVPIGFGLVQSRNAMSDDMMFDDACKTPAADWYGGAMLRYLSRGSRHRDEGFRLLVQHARTDRTALLKYAARKDAVADLAKDALFEMAKEEGGEDLMRFVKRGPHAEEADDALFALAKVTDSPASYTGYLEVGTRHAAEAKALAAEADYRQAIKSPLVGSLCSYVRRNPGSKHEDEAWKGIREAYAAALPAFDEKEHPPAEGRAFAKALLDTLLQRADPRVTVGVLTAPPDAIAQEDAVELAKHPGLYLPGAPRFNGVAMASVEQDIRESINGWLSKAFPRGVVEGTRPGQQDEEGRPRIDVRLVPVVDGISEWVKITAGTERKTAAFTPLVGLRVEVTSVVQPEGGPEAKLHFELRLEDKTDGRMTTRDSRGQKRSAPELRDDVYAPFLAEVPAKIAASFRDRF